MDLPPLTAEAMAELNAAGELMGEKRKDEAEPRRKRPRRSSVPMTPGIKCLY